MEIRTLGIPVYTSPSGSPTCALNFGEGQICPFLQLSNFGQVSLCFFVRDGKLWREDEFLVPDKNCPLWNGGKI
jgi:hypothetical protein